MSFAKIGVVGLPGNWSSEELVRVLKERTQFGVLIDMSRVTLDLTNGKVFFDGLDLGLLDAIIVKKLGTQYSPDLQDRLEVLRFLSANGVRVFSRPESIQHLLDRLNCTVRLMQGGIPIPPTVVTENIEQAVAAIRKFGKAVLKPLYTSKARGMRVLESGNDLHEAVENFQASGNKVIYIQKLVPVPGRDLGIIFLGGDYLATYSRVAGKNSWNTSTASGGRYEACFPSDAVIELARKAQALFDLDFTCVDLVETPTGPMVFEVSAFGGFRGLLTAHKIHASELYAYYVLKKIKERKNVTQPH